MNLLREYLKTLDDSTLTKSFIVFTMGNHIKTIENNGKLPPNALAIQSVFIAEMDTRTPDPLSGIAA